MTDTKTYNMVNVLKQILMAANQFKYVKDLEVLNDNTIKYKLVGLDNTVFTAEAYKEEGQKTRIKLTTVKNGEEKFNDILAADFYNLMYGVYLRFWENTKITDEMRAKTLKDVVEKYNVVKEELLQDLELYTEETIDTWLV